MKHLKFILRILLLSLVFSSLETKDEGNVTTAITDNSKEDSTKIDGKAEIVLSQEDIILQKWRKMEKFFKISASYIIKSILPSLLRLFEEINISSKCTSSLMKMIYGIKEVKTWAFRMLDASGSIPNGIFSGYAASLGDFDGCLSVEVPGSKPFRGQYCSVFINAPLPKWKPYQHSDKPLPLFVNFSKKGTVMEEITGKAHHFDTSRPRIGICVPSTCSREEIQTIVDSTIVHTEFPWNISVPTCDVIKPLAFSKNDVIIIVILSAIGVLAFIGTVTDVVLYLISREMRLKMEERSRAIKCLICFSAYTNTLRLLKKDTSPDSIKIFHGMKFITLLWVMLNHTYYYTNFNLLGGMMNAREFGKSIAFQMVINGFLNVETFFFISAVLVAYGRMKFTGKSISIILYIFRRVWRLTPPLMLIIATSILIPHMGSGPGWTETIGPLIDRCRRNWWTNLLFINNFISSDDMCFQWLWYIPVDTHLYILALLVIVPIKSRPRLALGMNILLFTAGIVATAATHIYYGHNPTAIYVYTHKKDIHNFADNSFFRTYTHITTCCIGMCVGYYLATKPNLKIPKIPNIFGWLSSMIAGLVVVYGVYDWNQGNVPGMAVSTLYMCTHKVVWALALSYITIACCTGNGGIVTSILSWSAIVPFSRLTYVAYIIHPILQFMNDGSARIPIQVDQKTMVYRYLANIIVAYGFAYIISMLFESPFMCLEKVIISRRLPSKASQGSKQEDNGKFKSQPNGSENMISVINIKKIENVP